MSPVQAEAKHQDALPQSHSRAGADREATGAVVSLHPPRDASASDAPQPAASVTALFSPETFDRLLHATAARWTGGLSPVGLALAWGDWIAHLAAAPGKCSALAAQALHDQRALAIDAARVDLQPWGVIGPQPQDHRFSAREWQLPPFNTLAQAFLLGERWWQAATTGVRGVSRRHENVMAFVARQLLDVVAPSNFIPTNPEVLQRTFRSGGENLVFGFENWLADCQKAMGVAAEDDTPVGRRVAVSKGKVIYRNELIELIQYLPTTEKVRPEPILIVPAWIMKYYILDLAPESSLVRFLTDSGFTVFMISWRNPEPDDRDLGLEDYRVKGVCAALSEVRRVMPGRGIHAMGYCLGGTLLAIAVAAMLRDGCDWLQSLTLLASQVDFTEAGELTLFINESQIAFLEDMMWHRGVLDARQMAGTFQILRSNDLIWSRLVRSYLMGESERPNDLMAWSADATRMPYRMHAEYLRRLFLYNDLAEGRYIVDGKAVALSDIRLPAFVVGTSHDHIAPWPSVHKLHFLSQADITFVLASGGHNAGIVAPLGEARHNYRLLRKQADEPYLGPDEWMKAAHVFDGSWWPAWAAWLAARSGEPDAPPPIGADPAASFDDAPGSYVLQR
ncbi:MAG: alpha/beta fold hydrolase [Pseudomonadota bacterium]